jgi:hypothetical protein
LQRKYIAIKTATIYNLFMRRAAVIYRR